MLFRRRKKLAWYEQAREFVWPRAGWKRSTRYIGYRVVRLPGTAYSIAAGFACGAAVSFTPFVGLHFLLGALMAWAMRANILASAIGTAVGNPWTFPFIWTFIYKLGVWMGAGPDGAPTGGLDFIGVFQALGQALLELDMAYLAQKVWPVWWPMLIGSLPTTILVWLGIYWPVRRLVAGYQHRRLIRRLRNGGHAALHRAPEVKE